MRSHWAQKNPLPGLPSCNVGQEIRIQFCNKIDSSPVPMIIHHSSAKLHSAGHGIKTPNVKNPQCILCTELVDVSATSIFLSQRFRCHWTFHDQWGNFYSSTLTECKCWASLVPRPFIGETAWQITRVQTVYGYDVKEITAPPVQAMNIGQCM